MDIGKQGIIKVRIVRDGENIGEEGGKMISLTGIVRKGLVQVKEGVGGHGFGTS